MQASNLSPGMGVKIDGKLFVVTGIEHRTPGNLRAFVQLTIKDVLKAQTLEKRYKPTDDIEIIDLDRREMEYLYSDSTGATFMDGESYEQYTMPVDVLGNALKFLRPNSKTNVLLYDGNPILIELPASVELQVKDCPPEVKGATVTNQTKDAEMETGLMVRVPAFIKVGENLRIATADGSYQSRA
ncbi:MAG: elongation factor P [Phycisphaerae bacterium]|jgi:elongation factor P|nr:elongation factor P [Phycisphaerales bacterium]